MRMLLFGYLCWGNIGSRRQTRRCGESSPAAPAHSDMIASRTETRNVGQEAGLTSANLRLVKKFERKVLQRYLKQPFSRISTVWYV